LQPGTVVQLGRPPNRIDLLTAIDGVTFAEAWPNRVSAELDGLPVHLIGKADLLRNKAAPAYPVVSADPNVLGSGLETSAAPQIVL